MGKSFDSREEAKVFAEQSGWMDYRIKQTIRGGKNKYYIYFNDVISHDTERKSSSPYGFSVLGYLRTARQLCYPPQVLDDLAKAKNDAEATRIMRTARELYL